MISKEDFLDEFEKGQKPSGIEDANFKQQNAFVQDSSQFLAALCTRRAGKTNALALRFVRTMRAHPNSTCRYIALTRDSAKEIMWPVLHEINDRYSLGATFLEGSLSMILPNGSRLRLFGADMKNFIRRLKGVKSPGIAIDEAQDFGAHIESLISDILEPSLADYKDAWLALTGTPGPLPRGLFFDITTKGWGGFKLHKWSLYDNPYLPDPKGFVQGLMKKKGWNDRTPTYLREYQGEWVMDMDSLLIKYRPERNDFGDLPPHSWHHILGVDIGHKDADALAVLAWSEATPNIYLVHEETTRGQDVTQLAQSIERLILKFNPSKIVMDTGALGLKIAEEFRRRRHIPVKEADKKRKFENVAFLNDYMQQGRFFARKDSTFAQDSYQVQIDYEKTTPDRLVVRSAFHSDIIDAVLYAFKESPAYTYQAPPKPKPKVGSQEWADQQVSDMERAAEEYFRDEEDARRDEM